MTPSKKPLVYIISAPSGSGKSTLTNDLLVCVDKQGQIVREFTWTEVHSVKPERH